MRKLALLTNKLGFIGIFLKVIIIILNKLSKWFRTASLEIKYQCHIHPDAQILYTDAKRFALAEGVFIGANTILICADDEKGEWGVSHLSIGKGTSIGEMNNIRAGGGTIRIGEKCILAQHISIVAANHLIAPGEFMIDQAWDTTKNFIVIEDDVWVGSGVQIMPGVTIGKGAVIGAGSVVTKDVEPNSIVVGSPAKLVRMR
jgi:acetyltransferase-like isoleucine patch superfamily enzyme